MAYQHHPLFWSFGLGTWAGVRVRVSWLYPLLVLWFCYRLDVTFGLSAAGVLFASVLFHEIGHVIAARSTRGTADEILIWPLGGLAAVGVHTSMRSQVLTALAGPAANLLVCACTLYAVLCSPYSSEAFNPLVLPIPKAAFARNWASDLQVLTFNLNWMLLLVNLIMAVPFDGGRALRAWLTDRVGTSMAVETGVRAAYALALLLTILALATDQVIVMALATLVLVLAIQESQQLQMGETYEESFMGYDFSQGYTSLEKSDTKPVDARPGPFQRWLERRREDKRRRQEQRAQEADLQLDSLLAKVHEHGIDSLTEAERRTLKQASERYRGKGKDEA